MNPVTRLARLPGQILLFVHKLWKISAQSTGIKFKKQNQNGGHKLISFSATTGL